MSFTLTGSLIRSADSLARWSRLGSAPLDADELLAQALKAARRSGFVDPSFVAALRVLLSAYNQEANLSLFGRFAARWDILRSLGNLLRFESEEQKTPAILSAAIAKPIFITGLPRSGTTFLHTLLTEDSANRTPLVWQTIYPYPLAGRRDTRREKVGRQLASFAHIVPDLSNLHLLSATTPQECTEITAQIFQSLRYDTTHFVPTYQRWLEKTGHVEAFRFHKRFLQHLQSQFGEGQWILKCPDHVFTLDSIAQVYPDARFVFVHRDPLSVLASVAKLTELLRRPFTRELDKRQIGRQVTDRWIEGAELIVAADSHPQLRGRIFHTHYHRLIANPVETTEAFYRHFGLPFPDPTRARIADFVARAPRGGYGINKYSFDEFGLDPDALQERFRNYMTHFDIQSEVAKRSAAHRVGAYEAA